MPPLRERRQDVPLLLNHFIAKFNKEMNKQVEGFSEQALKWLINYHFPGNIRELANIVESAMIVVQGKTIQLHDLPNRFIDETKAGGALRQHVDTAIDTLVGLPLKEIEEKVILATLKRNENHRKKQQKCWELAREVCGKN